MNIVSALFLNLFDLLIKISLFKLYGIQQKIKYNKYGPA